MVIDFAVIKNELNKWLNTNWDHNTILNTKDQELGNMISKITGQNIFYLNENPTAENIAIVIYNILRPEIAEDLDLKITLYETERNFVEFPI